MGWRSRIRTASKKAPLWRALDKLCRRLVVELRDRSTCQRCGAHESRSQIHWAHVINRKAKSIQWKPWNSLALCAGCHLWFDGDERKRAREEWWAVKWPDRAIALHAWRSSRPKPIDLTMEKAWLEQEIARAEAA